MGHCTGAMLLQRSTLSIFSATYAFARTTGSRVVELWPSVVWELGTVASLLPLLTVDLSLGWADTVLASDASEFGCGVCELQSSPSLLAQVGRTAEKWRYQFEASSRPRKHALEPRRDLASPPPGVPVGSPSSRADQRPSNSNIPVCSEAVSGRQSLSPKDFELGS